MSCGDAILGSVQVETPISYIHTTSVVVRKGYQRLATNKENGSIEATVTHYGSRRALLGPEPNSLVLPQ